MIFASSGTVLLHATSVYLILGYLVNSSPKLVVLFRWAVYGPAIPASNAEFPNPDLVGSYPQVVV
jgi:hypothetical protein